MRNVNRLSGTVQKGCRVRWMLSCAAAFCVVFCLILSFNVIQSDAKVVFILDPNELVAGDYTDSPAMADLLNIIYSGDIDLMSGSTEYYYPIGSIMDNSRLFSVYSKNGNRINGYQCFIYANAVYCKLFGEYVGHGTGLSHSVNVIENAGEASYEQFKAAGVVCGAYMRTTANKDGSYNGSNGHSLIIMKYDENEVTYIEGNGEGQGIVRGAILSWSDFNARQITGRGRRICHVTQPTAEYYNSLYGSSYVTVKFSKGISTGGTAPASLKLKYRQSFTVPGQGTLSYLDYKFEGWYCQRTDSGLIANTKGGWSSEADIASGKAQRRVFFAGNELTMNSYFFNSGGVHMSSNQEIVFSPAWEAPEPERPQGAFALAQSYERSGDYIDYYIDVENNPGVSYLELIINCSEGLSLISVENGDVLGGMYAGDVTDVISWRMAGDLFGNGRLLCARLRCDDGTPSDESISFTILCCYGEPGEVEFLPADGALKIQ